MNKNYIFTSESVSEGHPDKLCDIISDTVLDLYLSKFNESRVACETLATTNRLILSGEVRGPDIQSSEIEAIVREQIKNIGYDQDGFHYNKLQFFNYLHKQSDDIALGVDSKGVDKEEGAGDQGIMFGYACNDTENAIPLTLEISNEILKELALLRKEKVLDYLRPDSKSQVTIKYGDDDKPIMIDTIVISTQHDEFDKDENKMLSVIKDDMINKLMPRVIDKFPDAIKKLFSEKIKYFINPTGKFVIGGPHGDTGLTGRKIIIDTYGGKGAHGGGAFSGKDPSKVDRSAAYAARHISKNLVKAGVSDEILLQLGYAIGVSKPVSFNINTCGKSNLKISDSSLSEMINEIFDLRPFKIESRFKLRDPIYSETSSYGHMGRKSIKKTKSFYSKYSDKKNIEVELFPWEKLDYIEQISKTLKL